MLTRAYVTTRLCQVLFVACYNSAREHETLKGQAPAVGSGLTDHAWSIKELIERAGAA